MLRYLGYSISRDKLDAISKEVDNDDSGYISFQEMPDAGFSCYGAHAFQELLKLIRRVRDAEREAISSVFDMLAEEGKMLQLRLQPTVDLNLILISGDAAAGEVLFLLATSGKC